MATSNIRHEQQELLSRGHEESDDWFFLRRAEYAVAYLFVPSRGDRRRAQRDERHDDDNFYSISTLS